MEESNVVTPTPAWSMTSTVHSVYASYTSIFKPQSNRDRYGNVLDPRDGDNCEIGL
jgi:outer membrane receptor for ferric coprogen and ferric-rhodotorulic acid